MSSHVPARSPNCNLYMLSIIPTSALQVVVLTEMPLDVAVAVDDLSSGAAFLPAGLSTIVSGPSVIHRLRIGGEVDRPASQEEEPT